MLEEGFIEHMYPGTAQHSYQEYKKIVMYHNNRRISTRKSGDFCEIRAVN